jgi:hypothetical protein
MRFSTAAILAFFLALFLALSPATPATLAAGDVGYVDFSFGSAPGNDPTADKPQSKLWFNDGAWWGVLYHSGSGTWHIYRLNWPDQWIDTGVTVDNRPTSRADVLWDGTKLYFASLVRNNTSNQGRLYRFSYNATSDLYSLDSGFPVQIMSGRAETMAFDKDSTGQLWITFTQSSKVYVNRSLGNDLTWGAPFVVPSSTTLDSDDISSLVAYQGNIGVLWSNQRDDKMYFSYHRDVDADEAWQPIVAAYSGTNNADDHINLKSLQTDGSGRLFAAVKTSLSGTTQPRLLLLWASPGGAWGSTVFSTGAESQTRPLVLLESTNQRVYMFATTEGGGALYMKSTSMDNPDFSDQPGQGEPFVKNSTYGSLNNATSTKQTLSAATGLVVLVSDESKRFYLHNTLALGNPPADTTPPTVLARTPASGQAGVSVATNITATFSEAVAGVGASSFTLTPQGGAPVAAGVTYDGATRTATLNPNVDLAPATTYTAQLTGAIADLAGNALAPLSWTFTTAAPADTTAPTVTSTSPAGGATAVVPTANVTATFSEPVAPATVNAASVTLLDAAMSPVPASVSYDAASQTVMLNPSADLAFDATYTAKLSGAIADLAGNPLAPISWSFTIAAAPDTTRPEITVTSPPSGATAVGLAANVTATFSEPIDPASIDATSFTLTGPGGIVAATVSYDAATRTATLNPTASLEPGTMYTVVIAGARDLAGNTLAQPATWTFTTAPLEAPPIPLYIPVAQK